MIWDAFLHSLNCVIILLILGGTGYGPPEAGTTRIRPR